MNKKEQDRRVNRRKFIQTSAKFTASATILSMGGISLYGAIPSLSTNDIPAVTLNNGVKMPMLGFGTYDLRDQIAQNI